MKNINTPEKQCKYCYGKGYATQLRQYCIVGDFPGDITYTSEPEIIKIPCKCQQKQKTETIEEQETIRKRFKEWCNNGEHETWSDKYGYIEFLDKEMVMEFILSEIQSAVHSEKEKNYEDFETYLSSSAHLHGISFKEFMRLKSKIK
jgi:hypothetical protein